MRFRFYCNRFGNWINDNLEKIQGISFLLLYFLSVTCALRQVISKYEEIFMQQTHLSAREADFIICGLCITISFWLLNKLFINIPIVKEFCRFLIPIWNCVFGIVGFMRMYILCWLIVGFTVVSLRMANYQIGEGNGIASVFAIHTCIVILLSTKFGENWINRWYRKSQWAIGNDKIYSKDILRFLIYLFYFIGIIYVTYLDLEWRVSTETKTLMGALLSSLAAFVAFDNLKQTYNNIFRKPTR
ncbi:hypothetical protein [uncultured Rikenella sp.]|uniref:hypothetical protein n=1 Tax=uncultured Rikenella sp. TaxID=368003 RepID=UPI00261BB5D1|nr:hypothetical protein [uncultured Rikenella sp.]